LQTLDAKLREEVNIEGFDNAEVERIMENLRSSIEELQKEVVRALNIFDSITHLSV